MSVLPEVLAANDSYAKSFGDKGSLALPPARGFAILTCMDARLDPAKYAGLAEGDAVQPLPSIGDGMLGMGQSQAQRLRPVLCRLHNEVGAQSQL